MTNEKFLSLTRTEQRIAIAKDALSLISSKTIYVLQGMFLRRTYTSFEENIQSDLMKNEGKNVCGVCAKGALFVSAIYNINEMEYSDADLNHMFNSSFENPAHRVLLNYFDKDQLDLIETAFEGKSFLNAAPIKDIVRAQYFFDKVHYANPRLIKILNNIIDNNGTFIP